MSMISKHFSRALLDCSRLVSVVGKEDLYRGTWLPVDRREWMELGGTVKDFWRWAS
jgi:hypothetical protein